MDKLKVIEAFQSYQGEGPDVGRRQLILRYKFCNRVRDNKACNFCDTVLKMRISNETEISFEEIQKTVSDNKLGILLTGGEPTEERHLESSINLINEINCHLFNIETNGYRLTKLIENVDKFKNVKYILSPKIFNEDDYKFYTDLIPQIQDNSNVFIKLVYQERKLIIDFLDYLNIFNNNHRVFLMPEGITKDQILDHAPIVFDAAEKYKVNFSSREHVIYGFI